MADGNVVESGKKSSALDKLVKSLEGVKKPNASDVKAVTEKFKKSMGERAKLQKALDDFDSQSNEIAIEMVKCYGKKHLTINGARYVPTSRGERVYYKKMSDSHDTIEL